MAENSGNGATPVLAFIVGGLLVVVAVIAFMMYSGGGLGQSKSVEGCAAASLSNSADEISDTSATEGAGNSAGANSHSPRATQRIRPTCPTPERIVPRSIALPNQPA